MQDYQEIEGNLISLAENGAFDVVAHGCNCWNTMGGGIAPQMAKAFNCDSFRMETELYRGDYNKLGQIEYMYVSKDKQLHCMKSNEYPLAVVNCYTQFNLGGKHPLSYNALSLCLQKINYYFEGQHIGLPKIGAGLGGGNWNTIKDIIQRKLTNCKTTVVIYK